MDEVMPAAPGGGLISSRQAARVLARLGLNRTRAQMVLATGLAGEPITTTSAHLYDAERVHRLADQAPVSEQELVALGLAALFVDRAGGGHSVPSFGDPVALGRRWPICPWHVLELCWRIERRGALPFVTTVCGFVVFGADIVESGRKHVFAEPGRWYDTLRGRRLSTGPGRPWVVREWSPRGDRPVHVGRSTGR